MFGGGGKPEVCCLSSAAPAYCWTPPPPLPGLSAIGEGEREGGEVTGGEVKGYSQRWDGGKINKGRMEESFSCSFGGVGNPFPSYVKQNDK